MELNKEFKKFSEIIDSIIETEFYADRFFISDKDVQTRVEKLKFICLKQNLCDVNELENLPNLDEEDLLKFCSELKENVKKEFLDKTSTITDNVNKIELNKSFNKFYEVYENIILTETCLFVFRNFPDHWELYFNRLKFICLKQNLCEVDELENLSIENRERSLKFCSELKESIIYEFREKISN